eukprot:6198695-Pleurochrysis_carterae.AAC.2
MGWGVVPPQLTLLRCVKTTGGCRSKRARRTREIAHVVLAVPRPPPPPRPPQPPPGQCAKHGEQHAAGQAVAVAAPAPPPRDVAWQPSSSTTPCPHRCLRKL